jgi:hypothetical protein
MDASLNQRDFLLIFFCSNGMCSKTIVTENVSISIKCALYLLFG